MMFGLLVSISGLLVLFDQELREERTLWPKQEEKNFRDYTSNLAFEENRPCIQKVGAACYDA
jgi:hypothetical protein